MTGVGLRLIVFSQIILLILGCAMQVKKPEEKNIPAGNKPAAVSKQPANVSKEPAAVSKEPATITEEPAAVSAKEPFSIEGVALYYAKRYKGRKTSSGERYDPKALTAAHPSLPLGKHVKIINLANNKSVIVKINDRCRKYDYELIDLSRAAARKLGFLHQGKARVRIIPLDI